MKTTLDITVNVVEPKGIKRVFPVFAMPIFYYGCIDYFISDQSRFKGIWWYTPRVWIAISLIMTIQMLLTYFKPSDRNIRLSLNMAFTWFLLRWVSNVTLHWKYGLQASANWLAWLFMTAILTHFVLTTRQYYIHLLEENQALQALVAALSKKENND